MKTKLETLTKDHPRWSEFYNRLGQIKECRHTTDSAFETLNAMGGFDVQASLDAMHKLGGHCDCEILMNIIVPDGPPTVSSGGMPF